MAKGAPKSVEPKWFGDFIAAPAPQGMEEAHEAGKTLAGRMRDKVERVFAVLGVVDVESLHGRRDYIIKLLRRVDQLKGKPAQAVEELEAAAKDLPPLPRNTVPPPPGPGQTGEGPQVIPTATDDDVRAAAAGHKAGKATEDEMRSGSERKARGARLTAKGRDEVQATPSGRGAREGNR